MIRIALTAMAVALALGSVQSGAQAQVAGADFTYAPVSPGSWGYRATTLGSEAAFVDGTGTRRMVVSCVRTTRQVTFSRASAAPAASLSIWTSTASSTLTSRFEQLAQRVTAVTTAYDPLLDAIAFSRGRFALSMPGSAPLVLPTGAEVDHVIEDCRTA
ncbi:MAG TPA: hypothetical protein VGE68_00980 [Sphingomicrobium sp.]